MAGLTTVVNFGQNQKLPAFKRKFLPSLDINLNRFVTIHILIVSFLSNIQFV